jgi:hypothetical protein
VKKRKGNFASTKGRADRSDTAVAPSASDIYLRAAELIDADAYLMQLSGNSCCMISHVKFGSLYNFGQGSYHCAEREQYIALFGPDGPESSTFWGEGWGKQQRVIALLLMSEIAKDSV